MSRYDYWTHGVQTFAEGPARRIDNNEPVPGLDVCHVGWGTIVKQPAGTTNWFHLGVPTPTIIDDETPLSMVIMA
ncbi:MAG: hypothetical protein ACRDZ3_07175, partial [Acidimicrobiia bacterium]